MSPLIRIRVGKPPIAPVGRRPGNPGHCSLCGKSGHQRRNARYHPPLAYRPLALGDDRAPREAGW